MSDSKLQRRALTAEIIGGAAIVISLLFVGYEVRQSTKEAALNRKALEVAAHQSLMESIASLNDPMIRDPELVKIWEKSKRSEPLTDLERARLAFILNTTLRHGDMAYFQFRNGMISEETLRSVLRIVRGRLVGHPGNLELWNDMKHRRFSKDYADYVDAMLEE